MSLAQGNNTPTRPRIEPGSPDPESDALTTKPVRSPFTNLSLVNVAISRSLNIALFVNRLSASIISLILVPNVG